MLNADDAVLVAHCGAELQQIVGWLSTHGLQLAICSRTMHERRLLLHVDSVGDASAVGALSC